MTSYKKDSHTFACFVSSDQNKVSLGPESTICILNIYSMITDRIDQRQYCLYILNDFLLFFPSQVNQPRHSMTAADCRMWKTAQGKATDILQQAMVDSQRLRETKEPGKGNGHSRSTYGMHKLSAYGTLSQGGRAKSLLVKASPLAESLLANAPNRR